MPAKHTISEGQDYSKYLQIVGIGIDPDGTDADFYVVMVVDPRGHDTPIMNDGNILLFSTIALSSTALELSDLDVMSLGPVPSEEDIQVDVTQAIYLIQYQNKDENSVILDFLNVYLDLVRVTGFDIPTEYKNLIFDFANHLTFADEFSSFLEMKDVQRPQLINGVLWLIGAVVTSAKVIR